MSGIVVGTRLDQLLQLRARVDDEIRIERARLALEAARHTPRTPDPAAVRAWAHQRGLLPREQQRGRIPGHVVQAYLEHQNGATP